MLAGQKDNESEPDEEFIRDLKYTYRELLTKQGQEVGAKHFSALLKDVAGDLIATATIYRTNREEEVLIPRVSEILGQLGELLEYSALSVERWSWRLLELKAGAIEALLGGFPFADMRYIPVEVGGGQAKTSPAGRPSWVPADERQRRQDLKHLLNESPTGLVMPSVLPGFVGMICAQADAQALAGMVSDFVLHLTEMPGKDGLARQCAPVVTEVFAKAIPAKFAELANAMEDDMDGAPGIFLRFAAEEALSLFRELPVEPGTVTASRQAAGMIEPILKAGDLAARQTGLAFLARRNPSGFRQALAAIVERIELQYDKDISPTGMGRRTTRSYAAPAMWVLINDVLNRIWPPENGSLTKSTSATVCSIVELTYTRGELEFESFGALEAKFHAARSTGIGNTGVSNKSDRGRLLVHEHVKLAVS